jgi:ribonuclease HII
MKHTENMELPTFDTEREIISKGQYFAVGIDEAGRGPLAGPVVASAVVYRRDDFEYPAELTKAFALIRDSKKLSEKQREVTYDFIQEHFYVGVGIINAETIDRVNILQATFLAMKGALSDLKRQLPKDGREVYLLLDGNQLLPGYSGPQDMIIGGDGTVRSIAAASIIAKVTRDRLIEEYDQQYPLYGFGKHKGYGTKVHMDALRKYGPTLIHRLSFKPVKLALPENANKRFERDLRPRK